MKKEWSDLREILQEYEIGSIDGKIDLIDRYTRMLSQRRDWAGLTSRTLPDNIEGMVVDSLAVLTAAGLGAVDVVEIGSGGGLLGIVVSIVCGSWEVTMVESSSRKSAFLAEVVGSLGIENVKVHSGRAEQLEDKGTFDLCLSRASGRLIDLAPVAMGLLKPAGKYIALKASEVAGEVEEARGAVAAAGGKPAVIWGAADLPSACAGRVSLVVIERSRLS